MEDLIIKFGYPALFVGSFLEGESALIASGLLARGGFLNLKLVVLIALTGTYIADVSIYFLGRSKGERIIGKFPTARAYYPRAKTLFDRYGIWAVFITRYLYGLRLAAAATYGLMKMKRIKYLPFNFLSCTIWAILVGGLGYTFGVSLEVLIGQIKHYEMIVVPLIILGGLSVWLVRRARSRRESKRTDQMRKKVEDSEAEGSGGAEI
ncbi:MAG: DedA family protein [Candidatus Zixiibacteriota bacterium]|nr:MAG: DedA family protein [candidate division Zixibacteria bacterium]